MKSPLDICLHRQGVHNYPVAVYRHERARLFKLFLYTCLTTALILTATYFLSVLKPASEILILSTGTSIALCVLWWLYFMVSSPYSPRLIFKFDNAINGVYGWIPSDLEFVRHLFDILRHAPDLSARLADNGVLTSVTGHVTGKTDASFSCADLYRLLLLVQRQNMTIPDSPAAFVNSVTGAAAFFEQVAEKDFQINILGGDWQLLSHGMYVEEWGDVYIVSPEEAMRVDHAKIGAF